MKTRFPFVFPGGLNFEKWTTKMYHSFKTSYAKESTVLLLNGNLFLSYLHLTFTKATCKKIVSSKNNLKISQTGLDIALGQTETTMIS